MTNTFNRNRIHDLQLSWFTWRNNADTLTMFLVSFIFACFTGLMAQVSLAIPWSPVLVTFQTFAVLLAGVFLGSKWGSFSMILYTILGIIGMPWFTNMSHGLEFIFQASGGYIIGFIFAAAFIGYVFDKYSSTRKPLASFVTMLVANFVFIYIPGLIGLYYAMLVKVGSPLSFAELIVMGLLPFVVGDLIKIAIASGITTAVLPKED
ncbi:MAG: biotin transporter BioY [Methanosphaera sp. rholeuAM74]|nr:MAG: biotin transporter BioY [Methanosphaera sp. rholeuAM74]